MMLVQKKINWVSNQIREERIELHRLYKELYENIDEQEKLRGKK